MSDKRIDLILKETIVAHSVHPPEQAAGCLSDEDMAAYVDCVLSGKEIGEDITLHITECESCFQTAASAISAITSFDKNEERPARDQAIRKAKTMPRLYPRHAHKVRKGYLKKNIYLFVATAFFIMSFISKGYFMQFLVAASIFGLKWTMDTGGSKALITIYDVWQHKRGKDRDTSRF
ncbi:MAG: hypothetical protein HQ558_03530 [Candidatus Omnitrophica bacterium]|nr:hypothetical protein [Candidatus Omnitrophota bacterium]